MLILLALWVMWTDSNRSLFITSQRWVHWNAVWKPVFFYYSVSPRWKWPKSS